jgi:hypothetical protein
MGFLLPAQIIISIESDRGWAFYASSNHRHLDRRRRFCRRSGETPHFAFVVAVPLPVISP